MRNKEIGNGKWEMEMVDEKNGRNCMSSKPELTVMMKSQAYRLAVVLQPLLLC